MRLKDKVIIVTGSTTGIGVAIAQRVVREGGKAVVHGTNRAGGNAVVNSIGPSAALFCADLSKADAGRQIADFAVKTFGRIDGIVNNAASTQRANINNVTAETFDRIFAVNVRSPLLLIQSGLAELKKNRGAVVNIGSCNAYCGEPNLVPYSMSKGALMTMSRNLADSLCHDGVRVNHMNLGWVLTDNEDKIQLASGMPKGWYENPPRGYAPSGKLIQPEEVANMVCYWLSDESRPISGTVMEFDQYPIIGRNPPKTSFE